MNGYRVLGIGFREKNINKEEILKSKGKSLKFLSGYLYVRQSDYRKNN